MLATPVVARTEAARIRALARALRDRESWSRERLLGYQRGQLQGLLDHAVARSAYYREVLGPTPSAGELTSFPILPKETLMAEFDAIVTDPRLR
jgi:phenylacetate-CoA ligase